MATVVATAGFAGCFAEPDGQPPLASEGGSAPISGGGVPSSGGVGGVETGPVCVAREEVPGAECRPITTPKPYRQRAVVDTPVDTLFFTETLFNQFKSVCGSCHVASDLGGFRAISSNFATTVDEKVLAAIQSDTETCELDEQGQKKDPNCVAFMPPASSPNGKPWSERKDAKGDPVTRLAGLMEQWIEAGRPVDAFTYRDEGGGPYAIDADTAETFTNLGNCLPDPGMVATELDRSCELDAMFAALEKKPESEVAEEQIGLPATLDQTDLSTMDTAELARHGVIAYQPAYPLWTDDAGKLRYLRVPQGQSIKFNAKTKEFEIPRNTRFYKIFMRKVLDREGVERWRKVETRVIVSRPGEESLYGTYVWNEQETQATLHTDPLNNGRPFKDALLSVVLDEAAADKVKADWEAGKVRNYSRELDSLGLVRRYAVPSAERCVQCHMGGMGDSFILGFLPLDVNIRPCDEATLQEKLHCDAGVYEPFGGDELTQLQRLISYGVITDYDPATQLVSLEDPQGTAKAPRSFRTPEELTAQGYILGNCAHCHNPRGYPSLLNPELSPLLDFLPSKVGGIFEFPLDRMSPRISRQNGTVPLPYITPSLYDIVGKASWKAKQFVDRSVVPATIRFLEAPWRSLIYRNVDTPFTYADDGAIFPHMPLNSPGFDCRAPRYMGEWMVSLPAVRKNPGLAEDATTDTLVRDRDVEPQPWLEVRSSEPGYLQALLVAQRRLETYRNGYRAAKYCPDTQDIVDVPGVLNSTYNLIPYDGEVKGLPEEGVPDRPHWVETDVTDPPGAWGPRRTDWKTVLLDHNFSGDEKAIAAETNATLKGLLQRALDQQKLTISLLDGLQSSPAFQKYIEGTVPFGEWEKRDGCDFEAAGVKNGRDFSGTSRPRWMTWGNVPDDAPVYETMPGAAVFGMVCINCHGPDADSTGRQAITLQEMTGGTGRVANFRDGLFGPFGEMGANSKRVFGTEDTAKRYLAWMALGGTKTQIPSPILDLVSQTPVLGLARPEAPAVVNANMLETARAICGQIVTRGKNKPFAPDKMGGVQASREFQEGTSLIFGNGDAELWEALCTFDNPAPIHTVYLTGNSTAPVYTTANFYNASAYPANTAVGNVVGGVDSALLPDNSFPWCVLQPADAAGQAYLDALRGSDGKKLPICPTTLLEPANQWPVTAAGEPELDRFATRGAINAGLAVYAYVDRMVSQGKGRLPGFNECELLKPASQP